VNLLFVEEEEGCATTNVSSNKILIVKKQISTTFFT
jgi:hypothetical protein